MSNDPPTRRPKVIWIIVQWLLVFVLVYLAIVYLTPDWVTATARQARARAELRILTSITRTYHDAFGDWPGGPRVFDALAGDNPKQTDFFSGGDAATKLRQGHLDPWGHPYLFAGVVNDQPRFYSAGEDGNDNAGAPDSDDIVSWR